MKPCYVESYVPILLCFLILQPIRYIVTDSRHKMSIYFLEERG